MCGFFWIVDESLSPCFVQTDVGDNTAIAAAVIVPSAEYIFRLLGVASIADGAAAAADTCQVSTFVSM